MALARDLFWNVKMTTTHVGAQWQNDLYGNMSPMPAQEYVEPSPISCRCNVCELLRIQQEEHPNKLDRVQGEGDQKDGHPGYIHHQGLLNMLDPETLDFDE